MVLLWIIVAVAIAAIVYFAIKPSASPGPVNVPTPEPLGPKP